MTPEQAAEKIILAIPSHALLCLFPSERDDLEKAINEAIQAQRAEAVAEAQKWQPIATAPKDGTPILAYENLDFKSKEKGFFEYSIAEWVSGRGDWRCDLLRPTHWMSLPAPPAQEGEG